MKVVGTSVVGRSISHGSINIQTDKQVSVYDVENSGPIQVSESQEIIHIGPRKR